MKRRFVVILDKPKEAQNEAFLNWIKEERLGWWHWFGESWLLASSKEKWTATVIRDRVMEMFPGVNTIVLQLDEGEGTWSGFGPNKENKDMFRWIRENWN